MHKTQDEDKQTKYTIQYVLDITIHKTQDEDKQTKYTIQYVLDITIHKTQDEDKQTKYTIQYVFWTSPYIRHRMKTNKQNTQYNMCFGHHHT